MSGADGASRIVPSIWKIPWDLSKKCNAGKMFDIILVSHRYLVPSSVQHLPSEMRVKRTSLF